MVKKDGDAAPEKLLLYTGKDAVCGVVKVIVPPGKTLDHTGIKLELIGQIGALFCFLCVPYHPIPHPIDALKKIDTALDFTPLLA